MKLVTFSTGAGERVGVVDPGHGIVRDGTGLLPAGHGLLGVIESSGAPANPALDRSRTPAR